MAETYQKSRFFQTLLNVGPKDFDHFLSERNAFQCPSAQENRFLKKEKLCLQIFEVEFGLCHLYSTQYESVILFSGVVCGKTLKAAVVWCIHSTAKDLTRTPRQKTSRQTNADGEPVFSATVVRNPTTQE